MINYGFRGEDLQKRLKCALNFDVLRLRLVQRPLDLYRPYKNMFNCFYRAMLCIRGTSHGPVSVRPSVRHKLEFY